MSKCKCSGTWCTDPFNSRDGLWAVPSALGTEQAAGIPVSVCITTCPHRYLFLPLLLCLEVLPAPSPRRREALSAQNSTACTSQLGSCCPLKLATFGDPITQSSLARFRPEEQFLLSALGAALGMLSSDSLAPRALSLPPPQLLTEVLDSPVRAQPLAAWHLVSMAIGCSGTQLSRDLWQWWH